MELVRAESVASLWHSLHISVNQLLCMTLCPRLLIWRDLLRHHYAGNTIANLPSFVVPYLSLALRKRFGSFMPICLVAASLKVLAALVFARHGAVKPARTALGPRVAASR
jgi:hypothetical protein